MKFFKSKVSGINIIKINSFKDYRGVFTRIYCKKKFFKNKFIKPVVQVNVSFNKRRATLRGLHYQKGIFAEDKVIFCLSGEFFFVAVNINKKSKDYLKVFKCYLSERKKKLILVRKNFATGFLTLKKNSQLIYLMSNFYKNKSSSGIRYNDTKLKIDWPIKPIVISKKDKNLPFL